MSGENNKRTVGTFGLGGQHPFVTPFTRLTWALTWKCFSLSAWIIETNTFIINVGVIWTLYSLCQICIRSIMVRSVTAIYLWKFWRRDCNLCIGNKSSHINWNHCSFSCARLPSVHEATFGRCVRQSRPLSVKMTIAFLWTVPIPGILTRIESKFTWELLVIIVVCLRCKMSSAYTKPNSSTSATLLTDKVSTVY